MPGVALLGIYLRISGKLPWPPSVGCSWFLHVAPLCKIESLTEDTFWTPVNGLQCWMRLRVTALTMFGGAQVVACEIEEFMRDFSQPWFERAGVADKVLYLAHSRSALISTAFLATCHGTSSPGQHMLMGMPWKTQDTVQPATSVLAGLNRRPPYAWHAQGMALESSDSFCIVLCRWT